MDETRDVRLSLRKSETEALARLESDLGVSRELRNVGEKAAKLLGDGLVEPIPGQLDMEGEIEAVADAIWAESVVDDYDAPCCSVGELPASEAERYRAMARAAIATHEAAAAGPAPDGIEQIRAEHIQEGDTLWIDGEQEWHPARRVVVREKDVLLWLEDVEDEPWDALRRDQVTWRLRAAAPVDEGLRAALAKIVARGGDEPPYTQMALDMWAIARAALAAAPHNQEGTE
jgi:hypothetical protein